MRIAVIADTHDRLPDSVVKAISAADEIWHLGDVCGPHILETIERLGPPVQVVRGNNDFFQPWPMEITLKRRGVSFRLIHIPPAPTKLGTSDVLLHGHTHVPRDEMIGGVRILNPGAVGKANKGAPPSYAWLTISPQGELAWEIVLLN
jgi:putative phosphoesterase